MSIMIEIETETLTDGSAVYAVIIEGEKIAAVSENDAFLLAEGLKELIDKHTNEEAHIRYP